MKMSPRERVLSVLKGQTPDKVPVNCYSIIPSKKWHDDGHKTFREDYEFCLDGSGFNSTPCFERRIISKKESGETVFIDEYGVTQKYESLESMHTPEQIDFTVKNVDDWKKIKMRLAPGKDRISEQALKSWKQSIRERKKFFVVCVPGIFFSCARTVGFVNALEHMLLEPDWMKEMALTYAELIRKMLELIWNEGIEWDGIFMDEDIAYKNGVMFSPDTYREIIMPAHEMLFECVHGHNGHVIHHSDGNMMKIIPLLIEAGVDVTQPLQNVEGMTARGLVDAFGDRIVYMGNLNVRVLESGDKEKIENEVKNKFSIFPHSRYIMDSDGSITNEVSWESYKFFMDCVQRYGSYE